MIARVFVRLASLLVPALHRTEWVREWEGELHELARRRGTPGATHSVTPLALVKGALPHALWLRRQHTSSNGKGSATMQQVLLDVRYALRSFRRSPGFTAVAVLTLMMGIGATTAIFSVVDGILLRPLPYQSPDALVMVGSTSTRLPGRAPIAPADFYDWREQNSAFEYLVASDSYTLDLIGDEEAERVQVAGVTNGYFELLGVPPLLGRSFRPEDDVAGSEPVAVLSYGIGGGGGVWRDVILGGATRA